MLVCKQIVTGQQRERSPTCSVRRLPGGAGGTFGGEGLFEFGVEEPIAVFQAENRG